MSNPRTVAMRLFLTVSNFFAVFCAQVSIYSLYAADVAAGLGSSFLVSPSITILDRAISMNASGAMKTGDSSIR